MAKLHEAAIIKKNKEEKQTYSFIQQVKLSIKEKIITLICNFDYRKQNRFQLHCLFLFVKSRTSQIINSKAKVIMTISLISTKT